MSSAVHICLPQERTVVLLVDHCRIGLLNLHVEDLIAGGVHCQKGNLEITIEADILNRVVDRRGIGRDPRCTVEGVEVGIQAQSRL